MIDTTILNTEALDHILSRDPIGGFIRTMQQAGNKNLLILVARYLNGNSEISNYRVCEEIWPNGNGTTNIVSGYPVAWEGEKLEVIIDHDGSYVVEIAGKFFYVEERELTNDTYNNLDTILHSLFKNGVEITVRAKNSEDKDYVDAVGTLQLTKEIGGSRQLRLSSKRQRLFARIAAFWSSNMKEETILLNPINHLAESSQK